MVLVTATVWFIIGSGIHVGPFVNRQKCLETRYSWSQQINNSDVFSNSFLDATQCLSAEIAFGAEVQQKPNK